MTKSNRKIWSVIVAGGSGSRFGAPMPKQYCDLEGRPVLMHTIENMRAALTRFDGSDNDSILLVIHPDCSNLWAELCAKHNFHSPTITFGGETRWHTVNNALSALRNRISETDIILIHDAARPIVSADVVTRLIEAIEGGSTGAVPTVAVTDSLRMINPTGSGAVDRSLFRAVQTPQAFLARPLIDAYAKGYDRILTDDASVIEHGGMGSIAIVEGDPRTLKITHPADIATAAYYLTHQWTD